MVRTGRNRRISRCGKTGLEPGHLAAGGNVARSKPLAIDLTLGKDIDNDVYLVPDVVKSEQTGEEHDRRRVDAQIIRRPRRQLLEPADGIVAEVSDRSA